MYILLSKYGIPPIEIKENYHVKNMKQILKKCPNKYHKIVKICSNNVQTTNNCLVNKIDNNLNNKDVIHDHCTISINYIYLDIIKK